MLAAVVVVAAVVGVAMKMRSGQSKNRVHHIDPRVAPKPVASPKASPRLRPVPSEAWMDASTNVNPISQ